MGVCAVCVGSCFGELCFSFRIPAENFFDGQILCVIPVPFLRWALVFAAFASSGYFLVMNVYPVLASVRLPGSFPEILLT